jgi:prepilin-type N-terminal cleavage/methylation domain-containing protein
MPRSGPYDDRGRPSGAASRGFTLLEQLLVVSLMAVLVGIGLPVFRGVQDELRAQSAARYLSGRLALARMEAVNRSVRVGLFFSTRDDGVRYAAYADGDADGVSAADIGRGIDRRLTPDERLEDLFAGVTFALPDDVPDVDGATTGGARDPVRIGRSRILTFTPIGTATSGTLYLRSRGAVQLAVRVLGVTGRTRVLRYDPRLRKWVAR